MRGGGEGRRRGGGGEEERGGEEENTCSWKFLMPETEKSLQAFTKASAIGRNEFLPFIYIYILLLYERGERERGKRWKREGGGRWRGGEWKKNKEKRGNIPPTPLVSIPLIFACTTTN